MKKAFLLGLLLALSCFSQTTTLSPDCFFFATFTATGRSPSAGYHNVNGCVAWAVTYANSGFSALSLRLDSAPGLTTVGTTPGTWASFVGTLQSGSNPNTSTTNAFTIIVGFNPWVSLNLTSVTGTGTITAYVYGYRAPFTFSTGTAVSGNVVITGPLGQAAMAASVPVVIANNQSAVPTTGTATSKCTAKATLSTSSSGATEIIALTGGQTVKLCNVDVISDGSASVSLVYGTGTNCGTGTTSLTPAWANLTGWSNDYGTSLQGAASNAVCLNQTAGASTQVLLTYIKE